MIDRDQLLSDAQAVTSGLVDDLRARTESDEETRVRIRGVYEQASSAERTDKSFEEWREDLLAQVAVGWVLSSVFVRFCEDNDLYDTPLLSGPGSSKQLAQDHRAAFFAEHPTAGDREWLVEVFARYRDLPGIGPILGDHNPMWQVTPSADGARAILDLWWATTDDGTELRHDFRDPEWDTRFLGDLYQDLSEHARKQFALLQTPEFVESFILDRAFEPAVETFGIDGFRMIDPTCGSGHFLLGGFERLMERWQQAEPATSPRELAQRVLDSVNGVDLNPFAVAVARFRLLLAALKVSEVRSLADAPDFHVNVATGDSLLHGTRPSTMLTGTQELAGTAVEYRYPTEDGELADELLQADGYHVVVGNPPYIRMRDKALNNAYRALYETCYRQYSLSVPFMERFFQLARHEGREGPAGWVGQITSNSFMKRQFGVKLVEEYFQTIDLAELVDTSGAYIPGHGTPTVILVGRDRKPTSDTVRSVLGIRGEPGRPDDPAAGEVWTSILRQIDLPGSEDDYISVEDAPRVWYREHPWSLQGGYAPHLSSELEEAGATVLESSIEDAGARMLSRLDDFFERPTGATARGPASDLGSDYLVGSDVRDWNAVPSVEVFHPYDVSLEPMNPQTSGAGKAAWPYRRYLIERVAFGRSQIERGLPWYGYSMLFDQRFSDLTVTFSDVATHNHFVLLRSQVPSNSHAPVIKLGEGASEEEHLGLLGLLNSSTACFWMKQVFHGKGQGGVGQESRAEWEEFLEFDSTKLKQFPVPEQRPLGLAQELDEAAQRLAEVLPSAVAERRPPSEGNLAPARAQAESGRKRMVALQEELDWQVYGIYGLVEGDYTADRASVPDLARGERAFEIVLARRMAAGEVTSTWFERHGSTPITELTDHWPDDYGAVVALRIALIESDRGIRLLERPEHKRRWNWDDLVDLEREAQESWLADRIESYLTHADPSVTTVAALADRLATDDEARQVAQDLAGTGVDLVKLVGRLVDRHGVPYLAALRLKDSGLRTRRVWERTWELQRIEDELEARAELPADHDDHLSGDELQVARKEAGVDDIPVPPRYKAADWRSASAKRLRGKLDVPKERFITYPGTRVGADASTVLGWAGWDHLQQATVLAGHFTRRKQDGAEPDELVPLLAGVDELVPWVIQWHNDPDPTYGDRMGDYLDAFVDTEVAGLGLTRPDLTDWRP